MPHAADPAAAPSGGDAAQPAAARGDAVGPFGTATALAAGAAAPPQGEQLDAPLASTPSTELQKQDSTSRPRRQRSQTHHYSPGQEAQRPQTAPQRRTLRRQSSSKAAADDEAAGAAPAAAAEAADSDEAAPPAAPPVVSDAEAGAGPSSAAKSKPARGRGGGGRGGRRGGGRVKAEAPAAPAGGEGKAAGEAAGGSEAARAAAAAAHADQAGDAAGGDGEGVAAAPARPAKRARAQQAAVKDEPAAAAPAPTPAARARRPPAKRKRDQAAAGADAAAAAAAPARVADEAADGGVDDFSRWSQVDLEAYSGPDLAAMQLRLQLQRALNIHDPPPGAPGDFVLPSDTLDAAPALREVRAALRGLEETDMGVERLRITRTGKLLIGVGRVLTRLRGEVEQLQNDAKGLVEMWRSRHLSTAGAKRPLPALGSQGSGTPTRKPATLAGDAPTAGGAAGPGVSASHAGGGSKAGAAKGAARTPGPAASAAAAALTSAPAPPAAGTPVAAPPFQALLPLNHTGDAVRDAAVAALAAALAPRVQGTLAPWEVAERLEASLHQSHAPPGGPVDQGGYLEHVDLVWALLAGDLAPVSGGEGIPAADGDGDAGAAASMPPPAATQREVRQHLLEGTLPAEQLVRVAARVQQAGGTQVVQAAA